MLQNAVSSIESSQPITAQLGEAGILMGVGMLSVFLFLSLLIVAMSLLAKLVHRFPGTEVQPAGSSNRGRVSQKATDKPSPQVVAAISAAIAQHQRNK